MLLNLAKGEPGADRVDRSGGNIEDVSRRCVEPLQQMFDLAGEGRFAQTLRRNGFAKASRDLRPSFRGKDVPHLGFSLGTVVKPGVGVVRMDLYRELFRGEEKLDQQREIVDALKPHLTYLVPGVRKKRFEMG